MILPTLIAALALAAEDEAPAPQPEPAPQEQEQHDDDRPPPLVEAVKPAPVPNGPEESVGAVFAPALMPRGSMSVYALLGAPDIGGGYRQGFKWAELEVRAWINYLTLSGVFEVGGKISVLKRGILEFAPNLAIGIEGDSGVRYYDRQNFAYVAVRPRAGLITGIRFAEIATGLFIIDVPWSIVATNGGAGGHFSPNLGFGAEVMFSKTLSGMLLGQLGVDVIKEPLGVTQVRAGWGVRLAVGFRLF